MKSNFELIHGKEFADMLKRLERELEELKAENDKDYAKAKAKLKLIKEGY